MKKILCLLIALVLLTGIISFPPSAGAEGLDQPEDTVLGIVVVEVAEIWEEPSLDSTLLAQCSAGEQVYIFYQQDDFCFVQLPGEEEIQGYMLAEYLETEEPIPVATLEPTEEPTPEPTEEPTPEPTEEPTPEPTEEPTPEPTEEPSPFVNLSNIVGNPAENLPEGAVLGTVVAEVAEVWEEPSQGSTLLSQCSAGEQVYVFYQQDDFCFVQLPDTDIQGYMLAEYLETEEPVPVATPEPTEEPTPEPTEEPTAEPTEEPTPEPTEEPTAEPTEEPTAEPTEEPTAEPTEEPTPEPTEEPTAEPTEEPTAEPTEEPTAEPTEEPTAVPTDEPVITPEPTAEPTAVPTDEPVITPEPTAEPTAEPHQPEGTIPGFIEASNLAIRETPDVSGKAIGNWYEGQLVYIYYQEGDYYYLNVGGTDVYGYGSANFITPESRVPMKEEPTPEPTEEPTPEPTPEPTLEPNQPDGTILGFITSSVLAIRQEPNGSAKVIGNWYLDQPVYIFYQEGEFYYLNVAGTDVYGYGSIRFIVPESLVPMKDEPTPAPTETPEPTPTGPLTEPTRTMIRNAVKGKLKTGNVNMRKGPSTKYGLVDSKLKKGTELTVYVKDGDWYFLKVDKTGKYGYISGEFVELVDDDDDDPTPKPTEKDDDDDEITIRLSQGDVNGDGLVSAADAAMILRYDAGRIDLSKAQLTAADMDGDDQVTTADAKAILRYVAMRLAR